MACLVLVAHARRFDFINDDAFISFRYAGNLVRHGELTYNVGERVEGYTNFLWTVLMAAVLRIGRDPVAWSKGIGVGCSLGTLLTVFLFSRWWARTVAEQPLRAAAWAAVAPLLLALDAAFAAWSEGGLETALFTLLMTASVLRHVVERVDETRAPWSGLLIGLAALTRPEGVLVFAVLAAHRLAFRQVGQRRPVLRPLLAWAGLFAAVFGPYWLWRYVYYGYPLPNTFYAKAGVTLWGPGWRYVRGFAADFHVWLAVLLLALPWRPFPHEIVLRTLIGLTTIVWSVYVAAVGGDFMALYRFLVPLLPLLALAVQQGLASVWGRVAEAGSQRRAVRAIAAAAVVALIAAWGAHNRRLTERALEVGSRDGIDSIGWLNGFARQTSAIGRYLAATYPRDTRIATTAAGAIPYYSQMPTLDMLGLNDLYVAHEVPARFDRPGHTKAAPESYVRAWRPDLLVLHPQASAVPMVASPAEVAYWRARGYALRSVRVPGLEPPYWSFLERVPPAP